MNIIPIPPPIPSARWVEEFVEETLRQDRFVTSESAQQSAVMAHPWGWLMDGGEAARWWCLAVNEALAQNLRLRR